MFFFFLFFSCANGRQKAVKNMETIRKREEAARKKEEEKKKKEAEKKLIENFVSGVKSNGSLRGLKPEQKALLSNLNKAAQDKEEGLLDQISVSLKSGQTFSRLRGHRLVNDLQAMQGASPRLAACLAYMRVCVRALS